MKDQKNIVKLEIIVIIQGNIEVLHIAYVITMDYCRWILSIIFHNGSNYDYHFIIKEFTDEFEKQFTCLGENTKKHITFTVPIEKELQELIKMEKKLQKLYPTGYNLLTAQDLWQAHYQIVSIIFLKEVIELHGNTDTMIKNMKLSRTKYKYCNCFLEYADFKDDLTKV